MIIPKSNYKKYPTLLSYFLGTLALGWEVLYDRLLFKKRSQKGSLKRPLLTQATKCVGCTLCAELCPDFALEVKNGEVILDQMVCSYCDYCVTVCPEEKISLQEIDYCYLTSDRRYLNLTVDAEDKGNESEESQ